MVMFFLNNEDEPPHKLSERIRRILRLCWATIIAFFMSTIGYRIGEGWRIWEYVITNVAYYIDLFWCWILVFVVMEYIYGVTKYLDLKQPWKEGYYNRMILQAVFSIFGVMVFMEMLDRMYLQATGRSLVRMSYQVFQMPFSLILPLAYSFFCCIESLKDTYFDLLDKKDVPSDSPANKPISEENNPIIAMKEGERIRLLDKPIELIWHYDGINQIYYSPEECCENHHTLAALYDYLDKAIYRKAGRNAIVHKECVLGYKPRQDKSIILELKNGYQQQLIVSGKNVVGFLAWYEGTEEDADNVENSILL